MEKRWLIATGMFVSSLAASLALTHEAAACGGCFHQEEATPEQSSVVTSHNMALSISPYQSVLWDQVEYSGAPGEFAWVLPVRPGAFLEVGSDAWFEALDAATRTTVAPPRLNCSRADRADCGGPRSRSASLPITRTTAFGCSSDGVGRDGESYPVEDPDPVTVVHQGSVGPYETVTLSSDEPGAMTSWLIDNGYAIDPEIQPVIDAYSEQGFDFIALKLAPQQGIQQMQPVRIVQPGAVVTLPLRMVAAGTGANVDLTLYVIGEGRWETQNFANAEIATSQLVWDFDDQSSNYSELRLGVLAQEAGRTWLTSYAEKGPLLSPTVNAVTGRQNSYIVGGVATTTIAEAFARQAVANGEVASITECLAAFQAHAEDDSVVAPACDPEDETCFIPDAFIDPATLTCGTDLDDLATALTGMRPRDAWVTRLEANLPRAALDADLVLQANDEQASVPSWLLPLEADGAPCPLTTDTPNSISSSALVGMSTLSLLALAMLWRRRRVDG